MSRGFEQEKYEMRSNRQTWRGSVCERDNRRDVAA
jgi:hypothetical protein